MSDEAATTPTPSPSTSEPERPTIVKLVMGNIGPLALNFLLVDSPEGKAAQCLEIDIEVTGYTDDRDAIIAIIETITKLFEEALTDPDKLDQLANPAPRPVWAAVSKVIYAEKEKWLEAIRIYREQKQALPQKPT